MLNFNDLLAKEGIDPSAVLVFRHRPVEPALRRVLPWLAGQKPALFNAYQRSQGPQAEAAMSKAEFIAAFIGHESAKALYVGLYRRSRCRALSEPEFWGIPENQELRELGMGGYRDERKISLWFDLDQTDFYHDWAGRLIIDWPGGERSWWRWAARNTFNIRAIAEASLFEPAIPEWDELCLRTAELKTLPIKWRDALARWRGIYFIFDTSDAKGYVGSACGADNIIGRWMNYVADGHGGNVELRGRHPDNFIFSILQRVSPDADADEVVRLESRWKERLHTREYGLNRN